MQKMIKALSLLIWSSTMFYALSGFTNAKEIIKEDVLIHKGEGFLSKNEG